MELQPVLVRLELGPTADRGTQIAATNEFLTKATAAGIEPYDKHLCPRGLKESIKPREKLRYPDHWGTKDGDEGAVAYLGTTTDRDDAVAVLSKITLTMPAVVDVSVLTAEQVEQFVALGRRMRAAHGKQSTTAASTEGRHRVEPATPAGGQELEGPGGRTSDPILVWATPDHVPDEPLDVVAVLEQQERR